MKNYYINNKGMALYIVLGVLLVVVLLANVILRFALSQSQITYHDVGRIQAYYAAQAGMNYALEQIRFGNWIPGTNCTPDTNPPCRLVDPSFPPSIRSIEVVINNQTQIPFNGTYPINITVNYTRIE